MPNTLIKYVAEDRVYDFDFALMPEIAGGQTIATVVSFSATPTGLTFGTPAISGTKVLCQITGGTADVVYTVTCVITTSGGRTLVGRGALLVPS